LIKAREKLEDFRFRSALDTWLFRVIENSVKDSLEDRPLCCQHPDSYRRHPDPVEKEDQESESEVLWATVSSGSARAWFWSFLIPCLQSIAGRTHRGEPTKEAVIASCILRKVASAEPKDSDDEGDDWLVRSIRNELVPKEMNDVAFRVAFCRFRLAILRKHLLLALGSSCLQRSRLPRADGRMATRLWEILESQPDEPAGFLVQTLVEHEGVRVLAGPRRPAGSYGSRFREYGNSGLVAHRWERYAAPPATEAEATSAAMTGLCEVRWLGSEDIETILKRVEPGLASRSNRDLLTKLVAGVKSLWDELVSECAGAMPGHPRGLSADDRFEDLAWRKTGSAYRLGTRLHDAAPELGNEAANALAEGLVRWLQRSRLERDAGIGLYVDLAREVQNDEAEGPEGVAARCRRILPALLRMKGVLT
jgi:hypothetical protein